MRIPKIGKLFDRKIAVEIGVLIVGIGFVGTDDDVFHSLNGVISQDSYVLQAGWSGKSWWSSRDVLDRLGIGQYNIGDLE